MRGKVLPPMQTPKKAEVGRDRAAANRHRPLNPGSAARDFRAGKPPLNFRNRQEGNHSEAEFALSVMGIRSML